MKVPVVQVEEKARISSVFLPFLSLLLPNPGIATVQLLRTIRRLP